MLLNCLGMGERSGVLKVGEEPLGAASTHPPRAGLGPEQSTQMWEEGGVLFSSLLDDFMRGVAGGEGVFARRAGEVGLRQQRTSGRKFSPTCSGSFWGAHVRSEIVGHFGDIDTNVGPHRRGDTTGSPPISGLRPRTGSPEKSAGHFSCLL